MGKERGDAIPMSARHPQKDVDEPVRLYELSWRQG
jgi:hypothetical protein